MEPSKKEEVFSMCLCKSCPSWIDCGEKGGFCLDAVGESKCIREQQGCLCGACPATKMLKLTHGYYCTRGSESKQSKK